MIDCKGNRRSIMRVARGAHPIFAVLGAAAMLLATLGSPAAFAADFYLALDVPHNLSGAIPLPPNWFLQRVFGSYASEGPVMPDGVAPSGLFHGADGTWLVTPAAPAVLGGLSIGPRDVAATDGLGAVFSLFFDGDAAGIPAGVRVDALFLEAHGLLVLSFDGPVNLEGVEYSRSDLVYYRGGTSFSLFWDAEGLPGVPGYANVVGADQALDGRIVVTFDVPTRIGGTEFLPGQLVAWDGLAMSSYFVDPAWPAAAQMRDFSLAVPAGEVPGGAGGPPGLPLTISDAGSGDLLLRWDAPCGPAIDYAVYEGTIGDPASHQPLLCSTGGLNTAIITPGGGNHYYLVVPRTAHREGSYGKDWLGNQRPIGDGNCLPQQIAQACD